MREREEDRTAREERLESVTDTDDHDERAPSPADTALTALLEAGPEAVEHLLKAAQELLLAAKTVVDAGERAVESHRATDAAGRSRAVPAHESRIRRIDLA